MERPHQLCYIRKSWAEHIKLTCVKWKHSVSSGRKKISFRGVGKVVWSCTFFWTLEIEPFSLFLNLHLQISHCPCYKEIFVHLWRTTDKHENILQDKADAKHPFSGYCKTVGDLSIYFFPVVFFPCVSYLFLAFWVTRMNYKQGIVELLLSFCTLADSTCSRCSFRKDVRGNLFLKLCNLTVVCELLTAKSFTYCLGNAEQFQVLSPISCLPLLDQCFLIFPEPLVKHKTKTFKKIKFICN